MKRIALTLIAILVVAFPSFSQNIYIQDPLFKTALINQGVDTNEDGEISRAEAEAISKIDLSLGSGQLGIRSLQGLEAFVNLDSLNFVGNQVAYMDFSQNTKLSYIDCSMNYPMHFIDISKNIHLKYLNCSLTGLDNLDVSNNQALEYLYCAENGMNSLDVSNNPALIELATWFSPLTSLDISNNRALTSLVCGYNQLSSLDVSNNTLLETLHCNSNKLIGLDLSNNPSIRNLNIGEMSSLRQVCVWESFDQNQMTIRSSDSPNFYFTTECTFDKIVNIPDANFLNELMNLEVDLNRDGLISYGEAALITQLNVKGKQISDLSGIEAFINLQQLNCSDNQISRLDLSHISFNDGDVDCSNNLLTILVLSNNNLQTFHSLNCSNNQLSNLILSNTSFDYDGGLDCSNNLLTSLILYNIRFKGDARLDCSNNLLNSLDFSELKNLLHLNCSHNKLDSLDLSGFNFGHYGEGSVDCSVNQLKKLIFSEGTSPGILDCSYNQLSSLSFHNNLYNLNCSYNQFSQVDVSDCSMLQALDCSGNQIVNLDISNNEILFNNLYYNDRGYLYLSDMPSLLQVCIGELAFHPEEMNGKLNIEGSPNVYFTSECNSRIVSITDSAFLKALIDAGVDNNEDKMISYGEAEAITSLDLGFRDGDVGKGSIFNISGIEAFKNLDTLDISRHPIKSLVLWNQPHLKYLNAAGCKLEYIEVRFCKELRTLDLTYDSNEGPGGKGYLREIDVSRNKYLNKLSCNNNQVENLDLSQNTDLEYLSCSGNLLTSLDLSNNAALDTLYCSGNQITSLDVSGCDSLRWLRCVKNQLSSLDVSNNTALTGLYCGVNDLSSLDVSNNTALRYLGCGANYLISSLDVSNNSALGYLGCSENLLTSLDVTKNTALWELHCNNNQLTSLDVTNNTALTILWCNGNQLTSLDVSACDSLGWLECNNNQLTILDVSSNPKIYTIGIREMTTLTQICVWEMPFPPEGVWVEMDGSPNVYFTTECSTGIDETNLSGLTIYPNPANNLLNIETEHPEHYSIKITNLNGQQVFSGEMNGSTHQIDLSSFQKGVYFITVSSQGFISTIKIVKL